MISIDRLTSPAIPLTVADLKAHARIDGSDDDVALGTMLRAAAVEFETAAGVALAPTTIRATFDPPPLWQRLPLPIGPVLAGATATATLDGEPFEDFELVTGPRPYVRLDPGEGIFGSLAITYTAGFGTTRAAIPADVTAAILDQAAALYDLRGAADARSLALAGSSPHFARIVARYRRVAT
jgi:uncharacterized phiE125 gp8 family phage protein